MTGPPATSRLKACPGPTHAAAGWLALAASPTLAIMAASAASVAPRVPFCASLPGNLPINAMATMYLLMSLFHLPVWLKLHASFHGPRRSDVQQGQ